MAIICQVGLPGKIGRCVTTGSPGWPPKLPSKGGSGVVPKEEPGMYAELFVDAACLNAIHLAGKQITDSGTRAAVAMGVENALQALKKRAGSEVSSITLED